MNIIPMINLLTEVMDNHADPDNPDYNGCDKDPCMWCTSARWHRRALRRVRVPGCEEPPESPDDRILRRAMSMRMEP